MGCHDVAGGWAGTFMIGKMEKIACEGCGGAGDSAVVSGGEMRSKLPCSEANRADDSDASPESESLNGSTVGEGGGKELDDSDGREADMASLTSCGFKSKTVSVKYARQSTMPASSNFAASV